MKSDLAVVTHLTYNESDFRMFFLLDENRHPIEIIPERMKDVSLIGNIYAARVEKLLPVQQACIVRIHENESAYLRLSENPDDEITYINKMSKKAGPHIGDLLFVSIVKDPLRDKDAVCSSEISLQSAHMVLTNCAGGVHVSRKLSTKARQELTESLASGIDASKYKLVVRTNANEILISELIQEQHDLIDELEQLIKHGRIMNGPGIIKKALTPIEERALHLRSEEYNRIVSDDEEFLKFMKAQGLTVEEYTDSYPISMLYSLESAVDTVLKTRVPLKSGAELVIEGTEAMYVIDVNSRFAKSDFLSINLEACDQIAREIRLRNLSGMILIDFINVKHDEYAKILVRLQEQTKSDPVRVRVHDVTKLGIVEITREKLKMSVKQCLTGHL